MQREESYRKSIFESSESIACGTLAIDIPKGQREVIKNKCILAHRAGNTQGFTKEQSQIYGILQDLSLWGSYTGAFAAGYLVAAYKTKNKKMDKIPAIILYPCLGGISIGGISQYASITNLPKVIAQGKSVKKDPYQSRELKVQKRILPSLKNDQSCSIESHCDISVVLFPNCDRNTAKATPCDQRISDHIRAPYSHENNIKYKIKQLKEENK